MPSKNSERLKKKILSKKGREEGRKDINKQLSQMEGLNLYREKDLKKKN
jgi:hypothetical protein